MISFFKNKRFGCVYLKKIFSVVLENKILYAALVDSNSQSFIPCLADGVCLQCFIVAVSDALAARVYTSNTIQSARLLQVSIQNSLLLLR